MAGFWDTLGGIAGGGIFSKGARKGASNFLFGTPERHEQVSTLLPNQQGLQQEQVDAAKGAFGSAADYYRNNLSDNPEDMAAFSAPAIRQFNEEIVPGVSEQFAGMGAGGLSSSGFRNAATTAGTDLAERLGAIRANLRHSSAQGLANMGQNALGNYSKDVMTQPGSQGFLSSVAPAIGTAAGAYFGGPAGAAAGNALGNAFSRTGNVGNNSSPYGSGQSPNASPQFRSV